MIRFSPFPEAFHYRHPFARVVNRRLRRPDNDFRHIIIVLFVRSVDVKHFALYT